MISAARLYYCFVTFLFGMLLSLLALEAMAADPIVTDNTNTNTSTSTSTVTQNSTVNSTSNNINTNNNTNVNTSTSTNTNNNTNVNTSTNTNNNTNYNYDSTESTVNSNSNVDSRSTVTTNGETTTNLKSPPPSAIAPQFSAGNGNDLCTVGVSGAVQTQILGISMGSTVRDMNCEKLKNAKTLYDMGMKVAAVSVMCTDRRVFDAMMHAGTPCPYNGMIGDNAKAGWELEPEKVPLAENETEELGDDTKKLLGIGSVLSSLGWLLLL